MILQGSLGSLVLYPAIMLLVGLFFLFVTLGAWVIGFYTRDQVAYLLIMIVTCGSLNLSGISFLLNLW